MAKLSTNVWQPPFLSPGESVHVYKIVQKQVCGEVLNLTGR